MTARIIELRVPRAKAPNRATNTVPGATVARAPTQLVPLKALAGAVLARNQARNRGATESHNCARASQPTALGSPVRAPTYRMICRRNARSQRAGY